MTWLYAALNMADTDAEVRLNQAGIQLVYEATQQHLALYNGQLDTMLATFNARMTEQWKFVYHLPATGMMQKLGNQDRPAVGKSAGKWDVALPLENFGDAISGDRVSIAYMTLEKYQNEVDGILLRNAMTMSYEMMKALFNNADRPFPDEIGGDLVLRSLANGDATLYPPVFGATAAAPANHYAITNYAMAAISATNNPLILPVRTLRQRFGLQQGGSRIVTFLNPDDGISEKLEEELPGYVKVEDFRVRSGDDTAQVVQFPAGMPGIVVGVVSGTWIVEWESMPPGYLFTMHLDADPPLARRRDPANTGLAPGLQLLTEDINAHNPYATSSWSNRYGFGVLNRLNGFMTQVAVGTNYQVPDIYQTITL